MKRKTDRNDEDTLRPEYDRASLGVGVRGKYLERYRAGTNLVLLSPEVAAVFHGDQAVNEALLSMVRTKSQEVDGPSAPREDAHRITSKYRSKPAFHLAYSRLIEAARHRGTATYQELAKVVGLPLQGNFMQSEIGHLLGEISEDENLHGRPLLSAIAVNKQGKPGPGFFDLARALGRLSSTDPQDESRFWEAQKAAVYALWAEDLGSYAPAKRRSAGRSS